MAEYQPLQAKENNQEFSTSSIIGPRAVGSKPRKCDPTLASFAVISIITIVAVIAAYGVLATEMAYAEDLSFLTPPGLIPTNFTLDERFRLKPSRESDEAWRSIIPNGIGIVQHPALGPELVSLAFVHQLHCLDIIRKTYFAARGDCTASRSETTEGDGHDKHVLHCLDYIRQALQCHADTNLEYRKRSATTGQVGFTGYGEHRCRDFGRAFRFAEEWRVYEGKEDEGEEVRIEDPGRVIDYDFVPSHERGGGR